LSLQNFKVTEVLFEVCLTKSKTDLIYGIVIVVLFSSFAVSMVSYSRWCTKDIYWK